MLLNKCRKGRSPLEFVIWGVVILSVGLIAITLSTQQGSDISDVADSQVTEQEKQAIKAQCENKGSQWCDDQGSSGDEWWSEVRYEGKTCENWNGTGSNSYFLWTSSDQITC